ncbi:MAG TPA: hypothetical protein VF467_02745, partial [Afipia sp.]
REGHACAMTKDRHQLRNDLADDDGSGWLNRFLAEEDEFDRYSLWRLASWGAGSVGVLVVAILATQSPAAIRRDQSAAIEIAKQSQQVQWIAKESQNQTRQLSAAVETLNSDRDRLYARVTVLEQGLDSVTGSLTRSAASPAPAPQAQAATASPAESTQIGPSLPQETKADAPPPLPKIAAVTTTAPASVPPLAKQGEQRPEAATADKSAAPAVVGALATPAPAVTETPVIGEVRRTEFGVDLGGANSIEGLRGLWRGAVKSNAEQLASLQPLIVVKERNDGWGMQLRLVAGPLSDAAAAAKICANLTENNRTCETSVFEGQRLVLQGDNKNEAKPASEKKPESVAQRPKRRNRSHAEAAPASAKPRQSSFSSFFSAN